MNAYAQAKHLFWKEYRTQRTLWLLVISLYLVGMALIQSLRPDNMNISSSELFTGGILTVLFYLLASTSILYASEKEQETDRWLRVLPTNPWVVLGLKVGWVLLSSLLALVIFFMAAKLIGEQPSEGTSVDTFRAWGYMFAFVFSSALICSQCSKHVLSAIGASIVLMLAIVFGTIWLFGEVLGSYLRQHPGYEGLVMWGPLVIWGLVPLELNRRWFRDSDFSWQWSWRLTRAKTLAVALEEAPYSNSWRRLVWKEWRSARLWLLSLFGLGFFFINLTHIGPGPYDTENRFIHFAVNMCLLPLLAGFASCRRDQSQDEYRFYGNHGVSSAQILLSKHAVWITGGFLMMLGLSLFVWMSPKSVELHRLNDFAGSLHMLPLSPNMLSQSRVEELRSSMIPAVQFWACLFFFFYAIGHWFSISIKQPVMSLLTSCFLAIISGGLVIFYYTLEVPLFILTIVPSAVLFSISFIWGEDWIADRRERRDLMRPFWYGLLGLWTVITLLASWRVLEIPASLLIDQTGFNNLLTRYLLFCLVGLLLFAVSLFVSDWLRSNLRTSEGRPIFVLRRDFRLGKLVVVSLVVHNLLLISVNAGYGFVLRHVIQETDPSISAIIEQQQRGLHEEDLYQKTDQQIELSLPYGPDEAIQKQSQDTSYRAYLQWNTWAEVTPDQKRWQKENRHLLPAFFVADDAGVVHSTVMADVRHPGGATITYPLRFTTRNQRLIHLARLEALRLEHEGQLEDAWRYHIALVRYARRFAENNLPATRAESQGWLESVGINHDLWRWMARKEQTPELLAHAAREFSQEISEWPSLLASYQLQVAWSQQFYDSLSTWNLLSNGELMASLPWERQRIQALQQEQNRVALELSSQLARKNVSQVPTQLPTEYERAYDFQSQSLGVFSGLSTLFIVKSGKNGDHDLLFVPMNMSLSTALEEDKHLVWSRDSLPAKFKTTEVLRAAPSREPNNYGANNDLVRQIANELNFWQTYRVILSNFAIYSYRAEKGAFPAALYDIKGTKTEELFDPILPSVAVNTLETEPDQLSWIVGILKHHATFESYKADYQWYHDYKWPQPEYNFGEAPDRKPITPLIAPKFQMDQPIGDDTEMREGYTFDTPESQETQP